MESFSDENVEGGSIDRRVQEELRNESRKRGEGHVQAVHQVWNDEVSELEQLLRNCGSQDACQERQAPEERARLERVQEIPPGKDICWDKEEAHQLVPLEKPFPHIEGEVTVIGQEVLVDEGELPHQEQGDACDKEEKEGLLF